MKKTHYMTTALLSLLTGTAAAQETVPGVSVSGVRMERNGGYMSVDMSLDLSGLDVESNRAVLLTPRLVGEADSLDLPSIGIYGRRRYYFYVRNGESMLSGKDEATYKASEKPGSLDYARLIPYSEWMDGAVLSLHRSDWGCCNSVLAEQAGQLGRHIDEAKFFPELVYVRPQAVSVKSDSIEGSAFIDFPVDKTAIYPDYRRNTAELGRIQASIDSVRNDKDVTITSVWLKGHASPESPYAHNRDLAIGRTAALKRHIQQLYSFADGLIKTDYEPEDWAGLRRYVEGSNLAHRGEILALIDRDMDPDAKEARIKRTYPEEYRFLLQNCYPALRHTDYRIAYVIRSYSDVEEIKRLIQTQPQKLSQNELYLAAQEYEPGTDEFTEVFETAVRLFPGDETANLNAANAAMRRGDNDAAARYLEKAGNTPEAAYARGALAIRNKDYSAARVYLGQAKSLGLRQAEATLWQLDQRGH